MGISLYLKQINIMVNERFVYFQRKSDFLDKLNNGEIQDTSIIFIEDEGEIITHNNIFISNIIDGGDY